MGFLAAIAVGFAVWLYYSGRLGPQAGRKLTIAAAATAGLVLLARGQWLGGLALLAAGAAFGFAQWTKGRVASLPMDELEARRILGVGPGAGRDEIIAAHRRLIVEAHPDRGGTGDLARRINAARDCLLRRHD